MSGLRGNGSVPTLPLPLPLPRPKSPPKYPDLYGKRRELAKIQILEREIGFLEEELKAVEGLPPASRSCKELADFVAANVDPLIPTTKKISKSHRFWKWLCGFSCFSLSWIFCCCHHCTCDLEMPHCPESNTCRCRSKCASCPIPKCQCFSCWDSRCFDNCTCGLPSCCCCIPKFTSYLSWPSCFSYLSWPSCLTCSCSCVNPCSTPCSCPSIKFKCRYPKCPKVNVCSYCDKNCCYPCYFCF